MTSSNLGGERQASAARLFLQPDGTEYAVSVLDLSTGGARLRCANPPVAGSLVSFGSSPGNNPARVAWSAGNLMGIQFLLPRSPSG